MNTQEILDRLKAMCEAATDEKWTSEYIAIGRSDLCTISGTERCEMDSEDADFFALSRTALPLLVEALERTIAHLDFWIADAPQDPEVMEQGKVIRPCDVRAIISDALAPLKDKLP